MKLCDGARRVIAVGFPTRFRDQEFVSQCKAPRVFIQSMVDEFGPMKELEPFVGTLPEPKRLIKIAAQDHFFAGGLEVLEETVRSLPPYGF